MRKETPNHNKKQRYPRVLQRLAILTICALSVPTASAYNFTFFGGRLGRPGVTTGAAGAADFLNSWSRPDNGTITWWLDRGTLPLGSCDAACFATLRGLVQPELDKWALWLRIGFSEAPNMAAADVIIRFTNIPAGGADANRLTFAGTTLQTALIRIDPASHADWSVPAARSRFCYYILHEWGHILGLGDLYMTNHGNATFEGEDFCDHGLPSGPLPDPRTKADNVMETFGVKTLDNDCIHGAEWLWGCAGSNAIVTGELATRTGSNNANTAAAHHGLTQTPKTWTYRGSVAAFVTVPKVTLYFAGIQAARDVGPGAWTPTIFPDRVEFDHAGPYEGNFKFELDCDQGPERFGDAFVRGASSTSFTAVPAGGGPQLFPFDQVYGADCVELHYLITCVNETASPVAVLNMDFLAGGPVTIDPSTVYAPACLTPSVPTNGMNTSSITIDWGAPCIPPGATVSFIARSPSSATPLTYLNGSWSDGGTGGGPLLPEDTVVDCFTERLPNGGYWTVRKRTRYVPLNLFYGPWFHPAGDCWYRWCCYTGLDCYYRLELYVYKNVFGRFFSLRRCVPLTGWKKFGTLPPGWYLQRQTYPPQGVVINGPIGPPPNIPIILPNLLAGTAGFSDESQFSDDRGDTYRPGATFASAFQNARNALDVTAQGIGVPPPPTVSFIPAVMEMAPHYCLAAEALQPLIEELNLVSIEVPDPILGFMQNDVQVMQQSLFQICGQMQTGLIGDPQPFQEMSLAMNEFSQHLMQLAPQEPEFFERFVNASEHAQLLSEGFALAAGFVGANMYDGFNDLSERDQFLWTQVARFPNELYQLAKAMDSHARINIPLAPPSFQSWQAEDQGEALVTVVDRNQVNDGVILDQYRDRVSEFGNLIIRRPDRADGNIDEALPLRVAVKYPRHLTAVIDIPGGDGLNVPMPPMIAGDVNGDDCIDFADADQVQLDMGQGGPSAAEVPSSDVDGDGQVTPNDLAIVQANIGNCGQSLTDCNNNGIDDLQEINDGFDTDCNGNGIPDGCDIQFGFTEDPCAPTCDCPGDMDSNGVLSSQDIQDFVGCALGFDSPLDTCDCADMDNSGSFDVLSDVGLFVDLLLSGQSCN